MRPCLEIKEHVIQYCNESIYTTTKDSKLARNAYSFF